MQVGDEVLAQSDWKDQGQSAKRDLRLSYEKITDIFSSQKPQTLIHITLDSGERISATDGHPFKTLDGWRDAVLLKKGGQLLLKGSDADSDPTAERLVTIIDVASEQQTLPVFNLEVANAHTFFVGEEGVLVHNGKPHGNSKSCQKMQYIYKIVRNYADGAMDTLKYGITGKGPNSKGVLPRSNSQLKSGVDAQGRAFSDSYEHIASAKNRSDALATEQKLVNDFAEANDGFGPPNNVRPQPRNR